MTDDPKPQGGTDGGQGSPSQQEQPKPQPQTPPPTPAAKGDEESHLRSEEAKRYRRELRQTQAAMEETTKTLKTLADELKAEKEARLAAEAAATKAKADADRTQMITEIATQYKLSAALAKRLQGSTKEELEADAKALAAEVGTPNGNGQGKQGGLTPAGLIGEQAPPSRANKLINMVEPQEPQNAFKGGFVHEG